MVKPYKWSNHRSEGSKPDSMGGGGATCQVVAGEEGAGCRPGGHAASPGGAAGRREFTCRPRALGGANACACWRCIPSVRVAPLMSYRFRITFALEGRVFGKSAVPGFVLPGSGWCQLARGCSALGPAGQISWQSHFVTHLCVACSSRML